ncbi:unnamed protein product [Caenorhabditis bovis]|uniref:BED-type domain-containing protein n=1 Tax=Caenorhabditis bovis TaxID=2654633 RepID=A0A8S1FC12_9PELO|nr:unnamed protein product [Caenorhabditis bovis]
MGRKKKKVEKPWCWYCNREFDDEKILIQHQKAKHFKCHICHKKLFSGPGLSIHCMQVHKETIDKIPGGLSGRDNVHIEIYGMQGVPLGASRGDEEPDDKRARMGDMAAPPLPFPPFPFPGLPPIPPGMPPFPPMPPVPPGMPPGMMPPVPPVPQRPMPPGFPAPPRGMPPIPPGYGPPPPMGRPPGFPPMRPMGVPPVMPESNRGRFDQEPAENYVGRGARTPPEETGNAQSYGGDYQDKSGYSDYNDQYGNGDRYRTDYAKQDYENAQSVSHQQQQPPTVQSAASVAASKLGSRTRIVHPDDHSLSLEERRAKLVVESRYH